ncbi:MAG: electron transfer flavoprotein subunit alpha/FixB family protein [Eubacterium sp.]|nr:electron transfer flavoprotein subunit alpha/FixB family protein [Eubacterium sp.]
MKALIFIETKDGSPIGTSLELFTAAKEIGAEAVAVSVNSKEGVLEEDLVAAALADKAKAENAELILLSATTLGKLVAGRVAGRLGGGSVNDVISIAEEDGKVAVVRPVYGGTIREKIIVQASPAVISVRGGSYEAPEAAPAAEAIDGADADIRTKVVELIEEAGEAVNLEDAAIIVTGGRGMGDEENFQLCAQLADALGGVVGATRPAIENNWIGRSHQVGQSGKIVNPDLYIACGVSGATQHVSGMMGSKYIIAINKDEDAPIFSIADIGIVGDVKQILPLMIEEVQKRKA